MRVMYLANDLDDAATVRRMAMLRVGGAEVRLTGFRRGAGEMDEPALVLGHTENGRMAARAKAVARVLARLPRALTEEPAPDVILARNLEMLAIGAAVQRRHPGARLVYELLDVHRLLSGTGAGSRALRWIEARLMGRVALVVTSSPGFQRHYLQPFRRPDREVLLVENKVLALPPATVARDDTGPLRLGWFGVLRCAWSLAALDRLTRAAPGRYRVVLRGRPALDVVPDFHAVVEGNPDLEFLGAYRWPDDLADIYAGVDLAWLIDRYEAGGNSDWLLPNRLYEGGLHGAVPAALAGTEVAARLGTLGIGVVADAATHGAVTAALSLDRPQVAALRAAVMALPRSTWEAGPEECRALVMRLGGARAAAAGPVLVVVPTLNEAAHIGGLLQGLLPFARRTGAVIAVADGGSTDGTREIVRAMAGDHPEVGMVDNPARLQAAGINAAVRALGQDAAWLLRLDAHSAYPPDYCERLLDEARATGADSVVVSMNAVGTGVMQRLIALAQNSRLGNGGSAHRNAGQGRWVDHGHHALMRMDAFREVGGYDEGFSHNEDAELDHRLRARGRRIWLTAATGLDYFPRKTVGSLMGQYFRFGRGRARNVMKHRAGLKPRQAVVAVVAPLVALAPLAPLLAWSPVAPVAPVFALPLAGWAVACLIGGVGIAVQARDPRAVASGFIAGAMHLAWSAGFWAGTLGGRRPLPRTAAQGGVA